MIMRPWSLAPQFALCASVFVGLLARMVRSGRAALIRFVINALESEPALITRCFLWKNAFAISRPAQDARRWSRRYCTLGTDPKSFRTEEAIRRSTAWRTNAHQKQVRSWSEPWCDLART